MKVKTEVILALIGLTTTIVVAGKEIVLAKISANSL